MEHHPIVFGRRRITHGLAACVLASFCFTLNAEELLPSPTTTIAADSHLLKSAKPSDTSAKRLWQISVVTLSVANVLDVQSSLGKRELNPALAGSSGTLGTQGILLKAALQGGLIGVEYLLTRSRSHGVLEERPRSRLYRSLAIVNFAATGAFAGIAAHNYTVPATR
jgi:hypothetical protein